MTNLKKAQEGELKKFQDQVADLVTSTENIKDLEDMLFPSKGLSQLQIAKNRIEEQKKNPIRITPEKKIDTRSVLSLDPRHLRLKQHLEEEIDIMIQRSTGKDNPVEFGLGLMPGSPYCFWKLPVNVVIRVPRGVALHLKNNCSWVKITHKEKDAKQLPHLPDFSLSTDIVVDSVYNEYNILDAKAI